MDPDTGIIFDGILPPWATTILCTGGLWWVG